MKLVLSDSIYNEMLAVARAAAPLEACGLLAGNDGRVEKCYVLTNVDASADHFTMRPEEQFAAVKDMRGRGLKMLAIWHSHPATPARMSAEDMRLAYTPVVVYVIISLAGSDGSDVRAFAVQDGRALEVEITVE